MTLYVIRNKWWSSSYILSVTFARCSWNWPFNHSWWFIRDPSPSWLCTMTQRYFHCEWTISSIPTTTLASKLSAVLWYYFLWHGVLWCHAMPFPPVVPPYCPNQSHPVILLPPWNFLAAFHRPRTAPALFVSKMSRGSVEGLDAIPEWQISFKITERPYQTTPPSTFLRNATDDVCPSVILMLWSRGITHQLQIPICVAFFPPQNLLTCLVNQK